MLAAPVSRKEPLSLRLLRRLIDRAAVGMQASPGDLNDTMRFRFFALVPFFPMLRYSDFAVLKLKHFSFFPDHNVNCNSEFQV